MVVPRAPLFLFTELEQAERLGHAAIGTALDGYGLGFMAPLSDIISRRHR